MISGRLLLSVVVLAAALLVRPVAAQVPGPPEAGDSISAEPPFSPRGAFFRSLVLPGWGQAYVGAPGRGAVYFSLATVSLWMSYVARQQLRDARLEQDWLRETGRLGADQETEFALARARAFEDWAAFGVFVVFLSGADAYVAAYLVDFDERIGVAPTGGGGVAVSARIPVGSLR